MTPERIAELRINAADAVRYGKDTDTEIAEAAGAWTLECLDVIEFLTRCMREVATPLRGWTFPGWDHAEDSERLADQLDAACAATYTAEPHCASCNEAEPLPLPVIAVDPEADALVDRLLSAARKPKQPEPERCNATLYGPSFAGECALPAGHADYHQTGQGRLWLDSYPSAKPHEPAREEPMAAGPAEVNGRLVEELKAAREQVDRLTKDRDEARGELQQICDHLGRDTCDGRALADIDEALCQRDSFRAEVEKLRAELAASLAKAWRKQSTIDVGGIRVSADPRVPRDMIVVDAHMPLLPGERREIDQLRAAIVELESIRKRAILLDLNGDGAGLDELRRRRAELFELCGVRS